MKRMTAICLTALLMLSLFSASVLSSESSLLITSNKDAFNVEDRFEVTVYLSADAATAKLFVNGLQVGSTIENNPITPSWPVTLDPGTFKAGDAQLKLITYDEFGAVLETVTETVTAISYMWNVLAEDTCDSSAGFMTALSITNNSASSNSKGEVSRSFADDMYGTPSSAVKVDLGSYTWTGGNPYIDLAMNATLMPGVLTKEHAVTSLKFKALSSFFGTTSTNDGTRLGMDVVCFNSEGSTSGNTGFNNYQPMYENGRIAFHSANHNNGPTYSANTWYEFEYIFNTFDNTVKVYYEEIGTSEKGWLGPFVFTTDVFNVGLSALRLSFVQKTRDTIPVEDPVNPGVYIQEPVNGYFLLDDVIISRRQSTPRVAVSSYKLGEESIEYTGVAMPSVTEEIVITPEDEITELNGNVSFVKLPGGEAAPGTVSFRENDIVITPTSILEAGDYALRISTDAKYMDMNLPAPYEIFFSTGMEFDILFPANGAVFADGEQKIVVSDPDAETVSLYANGALVETKQAIDGPYYNFFHTPANLGDITYRAVAQYADGSTNAKGVTITVTGTVQTHNITTPSWAQPSTPSDPHFVAANPKYEGTWRYESSGNGEITAGSTRNWLYYGFGFAEQVDDVLTFEHDIRFESLNTFAGYEGAHLARDAESDAPATWHPYPLGNKHFFGGSTGTGKLPNASDYPTGEWLSMKIVFDYRAKQQWVYMTPEGGETITLADGLLLSTGTSAQTTTAVADLKLDRMGITFKQNAAGIGGTGIEVKNFSLKHEAKVPKVTQIKYDTGEGAVVSTGVVPSNAETITLVLDSDNYDELRVVDDYVTLWKGSTQVAAEVAYDKTEKTITLTPLSFETLKNGVYTVKISGDVTIRGFAPKPSVWNIKVGDADLFYVGINADKTDTTFKAYVDYLNGQGIDGLFIISAYKADGQLLDATISNAEFLEQSNGSISCKEFLIPENAGYLKVLVWKKAELAPVTSLYTVVD